jgi:23S rRNA pseudouridine1911/1915/1917 synthase
MISKIIFEDQHCIVLEKPAGLLSQGAKRGDTSVVDWLRDYWGRPYVGLVHRLDRNVSGLMVVAKRSKAAARLTKALQEGLVRRTYQAWLVGRLPQAAEWRHWLVKDSKKNEVRVVAAGHREAREAILKVRPLRYTKMGTKMLTLAEFQLETGRAHQIRVQSAAAGLPLLGDPKYGKGSSAIARPALHAIRLEFPHPMTGEMMTFESALPKTMAQIG